MKELREEFITIEAQYISALKKDLIKKLRQLEELAAEYFDITGEDADVFIRISTDITMSDCSQYVKYIGFTCGKIETSSGYFDEYEVEDFNEEDDLPYDVTQLESAIGEIEYEISVLGAEVKAMLRDMD